MPDGYLKDLPKRLPCSYEEYEAWVKKRDGLRAALRERCYGRDPAEQLNRKQFAEGFASWMKTEAERLPLAPRKAATIQETLGAFFRYRTDGDVSLELLSALLSHLQVSPQELRDWLHPAPPFDVWRESWLDSEPGPAPIELDDYGMRLHRVQPSAATRTLNAYRRSWRQARAEAEQGALYTSPSSGFAFVVKGAVSADFFGRDVLELSEGEGLLYNMRHPHAFRPKGVNTVLLDVTSNLRGGVPSELFLARWKAGRSGEGQDDGVKLPRGQDERLGLDSVRYLIAFALSSTHMPLREVARHTAVKSVRLEKIARLETTPRLREVLEVAHLCRIPEEALFTPLSEYMETDVYQVVRGLPRDLSSFDRLWLDTHQHYGHPPANRAAKTREEAWEFYRIGRPPTLVHGVRDGLEVGLLVCRGPRDPVHSIPADHDGTHPSEELLYVLQGRLGVRLRIADGPVCEGTLDTGDAVWFTSKMHHSFFSPDGGEARSLHFRQALPPERG